MNIACKQTRVLFRIWIQKKAWIRVNDTTTVNINPDTVSVCTEVLHFFIKTYFISRYHDVLGETNRLRSKMSDTASSSHVDELDSDDSSESTVTSVSSPLKSSLKPPGEKSQSGCMPEISEISFT
jgi:hypothetical protein